MDLSRPGAHSLTNGLFMPTCISPLRAKELRREMKVLCDQAGIQFKSPYKLRHGHGRPFGRLVIALVNATC